MVSVDNLSVLFGDRVLFENIGFLINAQDRIGLVGKNGAGKSTLLKILAGLQKPDEGKVSAPKTLKIGYLPQEMAINNTTSVWEETKSTFDDEIQLNSRIEAINAELEQRTDYESEAYLNLVNELTECHERLQISDFDQIEARIEKVLLGMGFEAEEFSKSTSEFSGGWRMRIEIAKLLLMECDLLLLDEPTNHLDIESIQWMEKFLSSSGSAVVLVSHDKAFLDNITNRTIEISSSRIYDYACAYSEYLKQRVIVREQQMAAFQNQQKKIKQSEVFINRFRAKASKATQVQSRIKQLEKIDRIEIEQEEYSKLRIQFPEGRRAGKVIFELRNVDKSYGDNHVLGNLNFMINRNEKIALVGKNGEGKTTLSKMLAGIESYNGEVTRGHQVDIGYYGQNQSDILDKNKTVFETVDDAAKDEMKSQVRKLLGSFMFSGDDQFKKVKVLSGGEKARLALCLLLLEPTNVLILDEPTNHLDIVSKDILKQALSEYKGTLIIVSHDRDFLNGLSDKLFEVSNGGVHEFIGDVYEFLKNKNITLLDDLQKDRSTEKTISVKADSDHKKSYAAKKELEKDLRKSQKKITQLEESINELESKLEEINQKMMVSAEAAHQFLNEMDDINKALEQKMKDWEKQNEWHEKLTNKIS